MSTIQDVTRVAQADTLLRVSGSLRLANFFVEERITGSQAKQTLCRVPANSVAVSVHDRVNYEGQERTKSPQMPMA